MSIYAEWISRNIDGEPTLGRCKEWAERMKEEHPELRVVRGHYICPIWGKRGHWWCESPAGGVVDPTATQFPSRGIGEYVEFKDSDPVPTGLCPECGEEVFDGETFCSREHANRYMAYLKTGVL